MAGKTRRPLLAKGTWLRVSDTVCFSAVIGPAAAGCRSAASVFNGSECPKIWQITAITTLFQDLFLMKVITCQTENKKKRPRSFWKTTNTEPETIQKKVKAKQMGTNPKTEMKLGAGSPKNSQK